MEQIDFHFGVANRSFYACRLIKKVQGMGLSVAVWSRDPVLLKRVYDDLWCFEDLTFIPHSWAKDAYASECSVHFSSVFSDLPHDKVLILLDEAVPENWQDALKPFERVVDIVTSNAAELTAARARYRIYRAAGVVLKAYDRSKSK